MRIYLVFDDWRDSKHQSIYRTEKGVDLSMGDFHSGTMFAGEIQLDEDAEQDLAVALEEGYIPVFSVCSNREKE